MSLSNPNIFFKRLKKREPSLFLTKHKSKYDSYSRICPSNTNLQPVILTDEELANINPSSYNQVLRYGTDTNKPYNYICPRYWCLLTQKSMTQEEVDSGVCGKIIPKEEKKVPPGHYVYEFTSEKEHTDKNGNYISHYPGFKKKDKHPENKCIPCCFAHWNSKEQVTRRKECENQTEKDEEIVTKKEKANLNYILSIEAYPLEKGRYGKLPIPVQFLLNVDYSKYISDTNEIIISKNQDEPGCLFRYGVEQHPKQSFLGCLADIYATKQDIKPTPSIEQLKTIITNPSVITLDHFIRYHNGSLVSVFQPKEKSNREIQLNIYDQTAFYKSINLNNEIQYNFLLETIASFENFMRFIMNDTVDIDHTYLWDMFIDDNLKFIRGGVNLVIIEIANNDVTNNIEILCPTNSYLNNYYDQTKDTVIILKHGEFYEPIYLYSYRLNAESKPESILVKGFRESMKIKPVLDVIRVISKKYCSPKSSLPRIYEFERNVSAEKVVELLENLKYPILSQIMNYKNKIIGIVAEIDKDTLFIPCYPSSFLQNLEIKYMDDISLWSSYETTRTLLERIHRESQGQLLCKPTHKIIEDELVVGILTQTNQFIRINSPIPNNENDGLIPIYNEDYLSIDKTVMTSNKVDQERQETIQRISLENQFYSVFRSLLKNAFAEYENREERSKILETLFTSKYSYHEKLKKIEVIVRKLLENHVVFAEYSIEVLLSLSEILSCLPGNIENKKYCASGDPPKLIIPTFNLITNKENERIYFGRIADELLRYKRIQLFMFQSKVFLIETEYKINDDEFIILQSLLKSEYFKDLIPFNENPYLNRLTYDEAYPSITQNYTNESVSLEEQGNISSQEEIILQNGCIEREFQNIKGNNTSRWRKAFPNKTKEYEFKNDSPNCSFEVLMYIMRDKNPDQDITVKQIKDIIATGYKKYFLKFREKILTNLTNGGKVDIIKRVNEKVANFEDILVSEEYYLSDFDIWVFANETKTPIVLFSSTILKSIQWLNEATEEKDWMILYGDKNQDFYFIRSSPQDKTDKNRNKIPTYMIIYKTFSLTGLKDFNVIIERAFSGENKYLDNLRTLEEYLREPIMILKKKK